MTRSPWLNVQDFAAGGLLGAVASLAFGPALALVAVFTFGAVAFWRTDRVVAGLGTTALGIIAASLVMPFGPLVTEPLTRIGAVVAALIVAGPIVYAVARKAHRAPGKVPERKANEAAEVVVIPLMLFFVPYSCRYSGESPAVPN